MAASSLDEQVARLTDADLISATSIPLLESHVQHQVASRTYNGRVCRGLLKLYQMQPTKANTENIVTILVKVGSCTDAGSKAWSWAVACEMRLAHAFDAACCRPADRPRLHHAGCAGV
jgi:hypothetical protein